MNKLLMVFLRGGADGLSLLIPTTDPAYNSLRPTLRIDGSEAPALDDTFALHPSAPRLHELYAAGSLAAVPAVGFTDQTRSHFTSQAALERSGGAAGTGWLGRHLATTATDGASPFRGIAVASVGVPPSLWGTGDALATPEPTAIELGVYRRGRARGTVTVSPSRLSPDPATLATVWGDTAGITAEGALAALDVLETVAADPIDAVADPAAFGTGATATAFAGASAVLAAGLGTEIVMVNVGGWDTHNAQGVGATGAFAGLVAGLDAALGEILGRHDDLTALVVTEFGRRVAENGSGGTDHGTGSVVLVAGNAVNGGVRGDWPGLDDLADGDVAPVNDLRAIQAEIAADLLGTPDLETVVGGGASLASLELIA
ncbi:MAG: DUF1501 domain-containing protein [Acidimicrobiales bacterium]